MTEFNDRKFKRYWHQTEIIREYQKVLFTFGDMELPYVFLAQNKSFPDRTLIKRGTIVLQRPHILLPDYHTPEFEGFEKLRDLPKEAAYIFRAAKIPYSHITNKLMTGEKVEYAQIGEVIDRFYEKMEQRNDTETGLIKGPIEGVDIALIRYSFGLAVKSAPENINEFFEHLRKQQRGPIKPGEKITDEEIKRLFG